MKKLSCLLLVAVCLTQLNAQNATDTEYRIDASQRSGQRSDYISSQPFMMGDDSTLVLMNGDLYKAAIMLKLFPLLREKNNIRSIEILKNPLDVSRYTTDRSIGRIIKLRLHRKLARRIKRENGDYSIVGNF